MDPQQDLVTLASTGRAHLVIRPLPGTIAADLDKKCLRFRCDFNLAFFNHLAEMLKASVPVQVESRWLSGLCSLQTVQVFGDRDRDHDSLDIELRLIEVVKARKTPEVDPVTVSGADWGESLLARAHDESDDAMRHRILRGLAKAGPMSFRDSVRLAMTDLAESHDVVPMNGDGFAIVRAAVAKHMHISDVRLQVRPIGSGTIRIVLDEDRAKVMDWPEAPSAAAGMAKPTCRLLTGMTDVQRAIAHADSTGANPGSASYMVAALLALPKVREAAVHDCHDVSWMEAWSIAVVVDGGGDSDIAQVIDLTRVGGVRTLGAERGSSGGASWFTTPQWKTYVDSKELQAQFNVTRTMQINTHGKDIRPGTAVFTEKCARCSAPLMFTHSTQDAEAEAHRAKCFVTGDRVRWTSLMSPDCWADGVIVNRLAMGTVFSVDIYAVCSGRTPGRTPGNACVGSRYSVGADRMVRLLHRYDLVQRSASHVSLGPVRISESGSLPAGLSADMDYRAVQGGRLIDPMDVEYDGATLRACLEQDEHNRNEVLFRAKYGGGLTASQREAVSAYHSAQLRIKVAKSEADRRARETSVVIGIDGDDL